MSNYVELGVCDVCGHKNELVRTYYYYNIKCKCCSPVHFEFVRHCRDCTPTPPYKVKAILAPDGVVEGVSL